MTKLHFIYKSAKISNKGKKIRFIQQLVELRAVCSAARLGVVGRTVFGSRSAEAISPTKGSTNMRTDHPIGLGRRVFFWIPFSSPSLSSSFPKISVSSSEPIAEESEAPEYLLTPMDPISWTLFKLGMVLLWLLGVGWPRSREAQRQTHPFTGHSMRLAGVEVECRRLEPSPPPA